MANIKDILYRIITAKKGKDVRKSLHDGLDAVNKETEATTQLSFNTQRRQDIVTKQFDDQIANMSLENPSNAETVAMRTSRITGKSYDTAGIRVDDIDNQLSKTIWIGGLLMIQFGVKGDGVSFDSDALQELLDYVEQKGGGKVVLPPGRYILDKTVFMPANVDLEGHGVSTILSGWRPDGIRGYALIANKGISTEAAYNGAHDFSLTNITIDTPMTNGITLVHARNVYFNKIYGLNAYHHFFDIAGSKNVIASDIYITGYSGTAPYQIDGQTNGRFNNFTWDGTKAIEPYHDYTENDGIFLSKGIFETTNLVDRCIHLHRDGGKNIFMNDLVIKNAKRAFAKDPNVVRKNVKVSNVVVENCYSLIDFEPISGRKDNDISFQNVTIKGATLGEGLAIIRIHDVQGLDLIDVSQTVDKTVVDIGVRTIRNRLVRVTDFNIRNSRLDGGAASGSHYWLTDCHNGYLSEMITRDCGRSIRTENCTRIKADGLIELDILGKELPVSILGTVELKGKDYIEVELNHSDIPVGRVDVGRYIGRLYEGRAITGLWISSTNSTWDNDVELKVRNESGSTVFENLDLPTQNQNWERLHFPTPLGATDMRVRSLYIEKNKATTKGKLTLKIRSELW
ncbi:glycosyl hydrolase family 28-related protein [Alkalicoccobacillus gibsonii]|uniref:glycosyl hydrolase family 28-related protein n=1 Tax=Alkalicoccobacillus gibsonii TaxID=79881 RepID=UPI001931291C|nr:glycosyl hydrolase family 28-related protein [Alkalicoccobacillus gibsonii]MBM0064788.1 hypothetical protein [Alkalicoccobacillus gibsonii]